MLWQFVMLARPPAGELNRYVFAMNNSKVAAVIIGIIGATVTVCAQADTPVSLIDEDLKTLHLEISKCQTNLRLLWSAYYSYRSLNDMALPKQWDDLKTFRFSSKSVNELTRCPAAADKSRPSYTLNADIRPEQVSNREHVALIKETHTNHGAYKAIAYLDGSVQFVSDKTGNPYVNYQAIADGARWRWSDERANIIHSIVYHNDGYRILLDYGAHDRDLLRVSVLDGEEQKLYSWFAHRYMGFRIFDDKLYYTEYPLGTTGGYIVAIDLNTKKQL